MGLVDSSLEAVPDAMVIMNQSRAIVMLNHEVEVMFGFTRYDLTGKMVRELVARRYDFAQPLVLAIELDAPVQLHGVRHDATEFAMEVHASSLEPERDGLFACAMCAVSGRRSHEQAIHEETRTTRRLLDQLSRDLRTLTRRTSISRSNTAVIAYRKAHRS